MAIFALIESLSDYKHIEFYDYLMRKKSKIEFPITSKELDKKYFQYKEEFGSIKRCISFFKNLSIEKQKELIAKLQVKGSEPSIENFAKYLYQLRSEFVHRAELIHELSNAPLMEFNNKKLVICYLSMDDTMAFFEEGLIAWCQKE